MIGNPAIDLVNTKMTIGAHLLPTKGRIQAREKMMIDQREEDNIY